MSHCFLFILLLADLQSMAHRGEIQQDAPVKASITITINAPCDKVWQTLTDIASWPKWNPAITDVRVAGPLLEGTTFTWHSGGAKISSRIALVHSAKQIAWTGTALTASAIHVWKLQPLDNTHTVVEVNESMSGFLLGLFFSSKKLEEIDRSWLKYLKHKAER